MNSGRRASRNSASRSSARERRRFSRDVQRTIAALPEDEDALLRVEAALRSAPGFVGAPPLWRLLRRPAPESGAAETGDAGSPAAETGDAETRDRKKKQS